MLTIEKQFQQLLILRKIPNMIKGMLLLQQQHLLEIHNNQVHIHSKKMILIHLTILHLH